MTDKSLPESLAEFTSDSPTPRVDAFAESERNQGSAMAYVRAVDLARTLERELRERTERCDELIGHADELERALRLTDKAINPPDKSGISLHEWNKRLQQATSRIREALK